MNIIKNILATLFGIILAALLVVSVDVFIGWYCLPKFVINQTFENTNAPPPSALVKNPNSQVPEDFIVDYPGILDVYWGPDIQERSDFQLWNKFDDELGSVNGKNLVVRHQLRKGKEYIYNVTYKTDEYGRRITPVKNPEKRKKFIAFFGCSFVWGSCVHETETIPYYVGQMAPNYLPYNYARGASGTNYLLALLQNRKINKEIAPTDGIGVYVYIRDHVGRSIGDVFNTASMFFMPYYEKENNKLVRKGSFLTGRPFITQLYQSLYKSHLFNRLNREWPPIISTHIEFMCDLISESKSEFLKQFPTSRFIVVFHPHNKGYGSEIIPCLKARNISYLDYEANWDIASYSTPVDGHPNAKANKAIAKMLVRDLDLNKK